MAHGLRIRLVLLAASIAMTPLSAGAAAICEKLRERLAGDAEVIGNTAAREYADAINRQNSQIRQARSDLRRLGCSSGSIIRIGGENAEICRQIETELKRMEDNKQLLMRQREDSQRTARLDEDGRQRILAAIEANGCNEEPARPALFDAEEEDLRPLFGIAGAGAVSRDPFFGDDSQSPGSAMDIPPYPNGGANGSLRTLCVRTCDGAYFPISSNATPQIFGRDARICERMCPGTQTELYYHSIENEESTDMVSAATGKPYTALPAAFSYRNRPAGQKSSCSCNFSAFYQDMLRREKAMQTPATPEIDTAASGNQTTPATSVKAKTKDSQTAALPKERPYDPVNMQVRQVGPKFLTDESDRIDLKNPKAPGAQPQQ